MEELSDIHHELFFDSSAYQNFILKLEKVFRVIRKGIQLYGFFRGVFRQYDFQDFGRDDENDFNNSRDGN